MFIWKKEYKRLKQCEAELEDEKSLTHKLEAETKRLAELITSEVKDCRIGPWCTDCKHAGRDKTLEYCCDPSSLGRGSWVERGGVTYCKKHLHESCPEHELKDEM